VLAREGVEVHLHATAIVLAREGAEVHLHATAIVLAREGAEVHLHAAQTKTEHFWLCVWRNIYAEKLHYC
jgi:hypothetical protein